ncbi:MAG: PAS domain S-box protein [Cyclobacteriaceae bacterium]|nr:PAS domain S-box protein [Cyclobacteriaceae bacterium]
MIRKSKSGVAHPVRYFPKAMSALQDYAILILSVDGIILGCNAGAEYMMHYNRGELEGNSYSLLFPPEDRDVKLPEALLATAAADGSVSTDVWRLKKDGTAFRANVTLTTIRSGGGQIDGYSEFIRNMSDDSAHDDDSDSRRGHKISSNGILDEEGFNRIIAEVKDYAIVILDEAGYIRNWNVGIESIKGFNRDIIGQHFRIFYTPYDQESGLPESLLQEAKEQGRAVHEGWRVRKDKSRFWGSVVITALHDAKGRHIGFMKVTRDLTAKKIAEDQLRNYAADLEARNRELEQITYITSHDLQEPLRKIRTFGEVARRSMEDPSKVRMTLEKIDDSAARMSTLLRAIMEYTTLARITGIQTPTDLNQVFQRAKGQLNNLILEKKAKVTCGPLPVVQGDFHQMVQLMVHIISNALKYNTRVPEINVEADIIPRAQAVELPDYLTESEYVQIRFADNGIGFEKQYAPQIYDIFRRLHSTHQYPGTGIGLALCRRIVQNHRGHISASSKPGEGSVFYVYLPALQPIEDH